MSNDPFFSNFFWQACKQRSDADRSKVGGHIRRGLLGYWYYKRMLLPTGHLSSHETYGWVENVLQRSCNNMGTFLINRSGIPSGDLE